jgi:hypothetical protein
MGATEPEGGLLEGISKRIRRAFTALPASAFILYLLSVYLLSVAGMVMNDDNGSAFRPANESGNCQSLNDFG